MFCDNIVISVSVGLYLFLIPLLVHAASRIVYIHFMHARLPTMSVFVQWKCLLAVGMCLGVMKEIASQPKCVNQFDYSAI